MMMATKANMEKLQQDTMPLNTLHELTVSGSHYEMGHQVGVRFKEQILMYFEKFTDLKQKFIPFYETTNGKKIVEDYVEIVRKSTPDFLDEVKGISDSSGIRFIDVFMMHIRVELQTYLECDIVPECTTVILNRRDCRAMVHNEDTHYAVQHRGYILRMVRGAEKREGQGDIWAYCYPGIIPGNSFCTANDYLAITTNALYPKRVQLDKLPRQFFHRLCLEATSAKELREIIHDPRYSIATGASLNVCDVRDPRICHNFMNFELYPNEKAGEASIVHEKTFNDEVDETYFHYNMYQHLEVTEIEGRTTSSEHRKMVAKTLPIPKDIPSALDLLQNEDDPEYPIYRSPRVKDQGCTVATAVFNLNSGTLEVYLQKPKDCPVPVFKKIIFIPRGCEVVMALGETGNEPPIPEEGFSELEDSLPEEDLSGEEPEI